VPRPGASDADCSQCVHLDVLVNWWSRCWSRGVSVATLARASFRAQRRKALQRGASPLLLPEPQRRPAASAGSAGSLEEGELPAAEVLQRSEFLEPLDEGTHRLYEYLLTGLQSPAGSSQRDIA